MARSKRKRRGRGRLPVAPAGSALAPAGLVPADDAAADDPDESIGPPDTRERLRALVRSLQAEDFILFAWIVLANRFLEGRLGTSLDAMGGLGSGSRWIYAVMLVGLAIVFYTRGPADTDLNEASSRRCVLGLSGWWVARAYFAGDPNWMGKAFVVVFGVAVLASPLNNLEKLPRTGLGLRRALVMPAELVGNSVFSAMITPAFLRGAELHGIAPEYRLFASGVLAAFLFLYVVVAPRVMAGEDWRPLSWVARLGFYLSALWLGRPEWLKYGW